MDTWQQVSISVTREAVEATANLFVKPAPVTELK